MTILVGGVGELYQGDLDLGRVASTRLAAVPLGEDVVVEDLYYGAIAVAQRLEELSPAAVVLVGAVVRNRTPGTVERRRVHASPVPDRVQRAVADSVTGYVGIDLVIDVAAGLGVLAERSVVIEVEPARTAPDVRLSPAAEDGLNRALDLVRAEVRRMPLLDLADRIRERNTRDGLEPAPALRVLDELLGVLELLDESGRWGAAFALRDDLRRCIADGRTGYGMDHLDWTAWWALIEELDRLEALEAVP